MNPNQDPPGVCTRVYRSDSGLLRVDRAPQSQQNDGLETCGLCQKLYQVDRSACMCRSRQSPVLNVSKKGLELFGHEYTSERFSSASPTVRFRSS